MRRISSLLLTLLLPATVAVLNGQTATAPAITQSPIDVTTTAGGVASFRVTATGTAPLAYQWFHDAQPVAGATSAILVLDQLAASQAGRYFVTVGNSLGTATSSFATLFILPQTLPSIVDPTFHGDARLDGTPTAVLQLGDGRVLLAGGLQARLVRLQSDGRIDAGFATGAPNAPFAANDDGFIRQLVAQPDGRVLAAGYFADYEGIPRPGLVRLNADGTADTAFVPAIDPDPVFPKGRTSSEVLRVALQADGKILVHDGQHRLTRLLPDGRRDNGFTPTVLASGFCGSFDLAADGRIYVALFTPAVVARLMPDGSEDPTLVRRSISYDVYVRLDALSDGKLLVALGKQSSLAIPGTHVFPVDYSTMRWLTDGSADAAFSVLPTISGTPPAPDGTLFLADGTLVNPDGSTSSLNLGIPPYNNQGQPAPYLRAFAPDGRIYLAGFFSFYNGVVTSRVVRLNRVAASATVAPAAPRLLTAWSESLTVAIGDTVVLHAAAIGPGPLTYEWTGAGGVTARTPAPTYAFTPGYVIETADWTVRVLNAAGEVTSLPFHVTVVPATLRIVEQPTRVSLATGREADVHVALAHGSGAGNEIWRRNGVVLPVTRRSDLGYPAADVIDDVAHLDLGLAGPGLAGTYTVTVTNALGQTVTSAPIVVTLDDNSRFVNLSTRALVGPGEQAAILGLVIPPGEMRGMVLRGIGPTLSNFGVAGALADARLEVFNSTGRRVAANDDWTDFLPHRTFADVGAFELSAGSRDAVIDIGFSPGSYTVRLSAPPGVTGVGLIELYESDNVSDRLINVSSRVFVGPGATPAIAGFAIRGLVAKRVLVRAVGPGLGAFGVAGALVNPRLEMRDAAGALVAVNDDWQDQPAAQSVAAAAASAGAFALAPGSKDAALVVTLPAGNYTALVSAADGGNGVTLLEVYEVP